MSKFSDLNWGPALFLFGYQFVLLLFLPFYFFYYTPHTGTIIATAILCFLTELSITAGYHRLYSHRSYQAHPIVEGCILFLASMTIQGSALSWSFDHRRHHAFVDTDKDPYSINKGFWYAHFLWLLDKPAKIENGVVSDLLKNRLVQFQHRFYISSMLISNLFIFLLTAWLTNDYVGALVLCVGLRLFLTHHCTWFINSLAHTWGDKPFSIEQTAVNNAVIALLTCGEGYHNYHHTFANDYRNGIRWYHFDPTKWLIWTLHKLKLAYNLKRISPYSIKRKLVQEHKKLLLTRLSEYLYGKKEDFESQVHEISERLLSNIQTISQLKERYEVLKNEAGNSTLLTELKNELWTLQNNLSRDWKQWTQLSRSILSNKSRLYA